MSVSKRLLCILFLLSLVVCAVVNPGNFGTLDTARRLQVARWIRIGEPPVLPADAEFGLKGRNGILHFPFGPGQSIVLLPLDAAVSAVLSKIAPHLGVGAGDQRQLAESLIALLMQTAVTFSVLLLARSVLLTFGFDALASMVGAVTLLFGTTFLYYVQCAQENNLLLLLALCGLLAIRRWQQESRPVWPWIAGAACGFAVLVRLTSLVETAVLLGFAVQSGPGARRFLKGFVPPVTVALLADRWYHWTRFGEFWSTYAGIAGRQWKPPSAPAGFPFGYPWERGLLGALFSPSKSVFLFDPLLLVLILCLAFGWRKVGRGLRRLLAGLAVLLLTYVALYATYLSYGGDVAWGDRYVTLPVHLMCLFAVPLLLSEGRALWSPTRYLAWCTVVAALALQAMSTTLAANLEEHQQYRGFGTAVIVNRVANLAQVVSGHEDERRFADEPSRWRTFNYLPFQLRFRFPGLAKWATAGWVVLLASLPLLVWLALAIGRRRASP